MSERSELGELSSEISDSVDDRVNFVSWACFFGIVSVVLTKESKHCLGLRIYISVVFDGGNLSPFENTCCLSFFVVLKVVGDLFVLDLAVREELSDWFHSAHSFEVVKLECHMICDRD